MTIPNINPLSAIETDPIRNFKFIVKFTPLDGGDTTWGAQFGKLGFVSVSGLSVTTESIAYREGGYNTNLHQIPGQTSFTPITLSKGVMIGGGSDVHANWMKRLFTIMTSNSAAGAVGNNFRVALDIQVLSHPNPAGYSVKGGAAVATADLQHTSMRFKVYNAWITNLTYSNLDAGANSLMVEEMTLMHEGFDVSFAASLQATAVPPAEY